MRSDYDKNAKIYFKKKNTTLFLFSKKFSTKTGEHREARHLRRSERLEWIGLNKTMY